MKKIVEVFKKEDGFTLIEMSIVLVVIAVLIIVFVPNVTNVMSGVNDTTDQAIIETVDAQRELYEANYNKLGDSEFLQALVDKEYISEEQKDAYEEASAR